MSTFSLCASVRRSMPFFLVRLVCVIVFGSFGSRDFSILHITHVDFFRCFFPLSFLLLLFVSKCSHEESERTGYALTVSIEMWFSLFANFRQCERGWITHCMFARRQILWQQICCDYGEPLWTNVLFNCDFVVANYRNCNKCFSPLKFHWKMYTQHTLILSPSFTQLEVVLWFSAFKWKQIAIPSVVQLELHRYYE